MGLRDRLKRLTREAQQGAVLIHQRDGSVRAFPDMECWSEMFLAQFELFKGEAHSSPVLDAVRNATPESRRAFEEKYGSIEKEAVIVASPSEGGWVEVRKLTEDGRVEKVRHEDGPEAERIRREGIERGPAF